MFVWAADASFAAPSDGRAMSPRLSANKRAILTFGSALGSGVIWAAGSETWRRKSVKAVLSGDILSVGVVSSLREGNLFFLLDRRKEEMSCRGVEVERVNELDWTISYFRFRNV